MSRYSNNKVIQADRLVGFSFALLSRSEFNFDGVNKVLLSGEGLENDAEPLGVLHLAVILQQAHFPLHKVLMSLSILITLVWNHVRQTHYFPSIPPLRQNFLLIVIGRHVIFLGNIEHSGLSRGCRSSQQKLVHSQGYNFFLGQTANSDWSVINDRGSPGQIGAELSVGEGRLSPYEGAPRST